MEQSQDYSFNKAHAACYALIAYRTAWLKANHPCEYMAALISSVMNTKDRVPFYVNACHELGHRGAAAGRERVADRLRGRRGQDPLRPERGQERGRGGGARDHRARARRAAPFDVDLGLHRARRPAGRRTSARSSRSSSAARSTRPARRGKGMLERARAGARVRAEARRPTGSRARASIFDLGAAGGGGAAADAPPGARRPASSRRASCCGSRRRRSGSTSPSIRSHAVRDQLRRKTDCSLAEVERRRDGEVVTVGGIVSARQAADDEEGRADGLPDARRPHRRRRGGRLQLRSTRPRASCASTDRILVVKGRVDHKQQGETKLIAIEVPPFEAVAGAARGAAASSTRARRRRGSLRELAHLVQDFPGESPVFVALETSLGPKTLRARAAVPGHSPTRTSCTDARLRLGVDAVL